MTNTIKPRLFTGSYWAMLGANFMLFFAFYLIMPILSFYLKEIFNTPNSLIGVILACYTVAALTIRPFAGYLLDAMARKPLYVVKYFFFVLFFGANFFNGKQSETSPLYHSLPILSYRLLFVNSLRMSLDTG